MGSTPIVAIYFPVIIAGMVIVIMWGMSAAASRRGGGEAGLAEIRIA